MKKNKQYKEEFFNENARMLARLNKLIASVWLILLLYLTFIMDPTHFPDQQHALLPGRLFAVFNTLIVILLSFLCKGWNINYITALFALGHLGMMADFILILGTDVTFLSWIVAVFFFVGIYPLPLGDSILALLTSLLYLMIKHYYYDIIDEHQFMNLMVNTAFASLSSIGIKYVFFRVRFRAFLLRKKIESSNYEISQLNKDLMEMGQVKTNFFANISHEIRTPLTMILGPVEAALEKEIPFISHSSLTKVRTNAEKLLVLINDILDVSRLEAGRMSLAVSNYDFSEVVRRCCSEVDSAAEVKGIAFEYNEIPDACFAWFDRKLIIRAVRNLLSNSLKFTESGGKVSVGLKHEQNSFIVSVTDTGTGIPEDKIGSVFDRFSQADPGCTRRYEGTGIGLAVVREFTELHGGSVSVESRHMDEYPDAHGSVFRLTLPDEKSHLEGREDVEFTDKLPWSEQFVSREIIAGKTSLKPENVSGCPEVSPGDEWSSVLIVEDNTDLLDYLKEELSPFYRICTAENGLKAIEVLDKNEIDIVVSDVMMPVMDGYGLLKNIQGDERFEGLPVILLTGRADTSMKVEGLEMGAVDYVSKPFYMDELRGRIFSQLEMKHLRDRLLLSNRHLYRQLDEQNRKGLSESVEEKIQKVISFIKENYTADISREGLASAVDLSPDHLGRMFRQYTGKRISEYVTSLRIDCASHRLLSSDEPIIKIAYNCGFESLRTFNRLFLQHNDMNPTRWRESRIVEISS